MHECICSSCRNLKGIIGESGQVDDFECEYGFPSENCSECDGEGCEETCSHYVCDDVEDEMETVKCSRCGKELKQVSNGEEGEVFCISCYLAKED